MDIQASKLAKLKMDPSIFDPIDIIQRTSSYNEEEDDTFNILKSNQLNKRKTRAEVRLLQTVAEYQNAIRYRQHLPFKKPNLKYCFAYNAINQAHQLTNVYQQYQQQQNLFDFSDIGEFDDRICQLCFETWVPLYYNINRFCSKCLIHEAYQLQNKSRDLNKYIKKRSKYQKK